MLHYYISKNPLKISPAIADLVKNHCMAYKIKNNVLYCTSDNPVMNVQPGLERQGLVYICCVFFGSINHQNKI